MSRDKLRSLLILGRVSNLPTVWSNCLAAWMLASLLGPHRSPWPVLPVIAGGCSLLYLGGMYLNDACDVAFDTTHRPERPIPSGTISQCTVTFFGFLWIVAGVLVLAPFALAWALALAGLILFYDIAHKNNPIAPLLMAGCRALIYPMVGTACLIGRTSALPRALWAASLAMAAWVLVISILAKMESAPSDPDKGESLTHPRGMQEGSQRLSVSDTTRIVSNLLAAIPLVDLLIVSPRSIPASLPFIVFACLAMLLRKSIPST